MKQQVVVCGILVFVVVVLVGMAYTTTPIVITMVQTSSSVITIATQFRAAAIYTGQSIATITRRANPTLVTIQTTITSFESVTHYTTLPAFATLTHYNTSAEPAYATVGLGSNQFMIVFVMSIVGMVAGIGIFQRKRIDDTLRHKFWKSHFAIKTGGMDWQEPTMSSDHRSASAYDRPTSYSSNRIRIETNHQINDGDLAKRARHKSSWKERYTVKTGEVNWQEPRTGRKNRHSSATATSDEFPYAIFLAASAIARKDFRKARDPTFQKQNKDEYEADSKRYGVEMTLYEANKRLATDTQEIQRFLRTQTNDDERGGEARRMILDTRWDHNDQAGKRLYERELIGDTSITNYLELGEAAQLLYGEKLPTTRLWIHWKNYVIGCVPDGITDDYVYEFRATAKTGKDLASVEEGAVRQAQLYAYLFKRPNIKVQIAQFKISLNPFPIRAKDLPEPELVEISRPTTDQDALRILSEFDDAFRGN